MNDIVIFHKRTIFVVALEGVILKEGLSSRKGYEIFQSYSVILS